MPRTALAKRAGSTLPAFVRALAATATPPAPDDPMSCGRVGAHRFVETTGLTESAVQSLTFDGQRRL